MAIAGFHIEDKLGRVQFFQELLLLANSSMKIALRMLFLIFSNVDIQIAEKVLT